MASGCEMAADDPPRTRRYPPYAMPSFDGVERIGVFAPGPEGFDQLEGTLDRFHAEGVALIIQLGEALFMRGTARGTEIDHYRRLLRLRQQAMLVCTDDLGRAAHLLRAGVRGKEARTVRPNLVHLDCGFRTRLSNDDLFIVACPSPTPPDHPGTKLACGEDSDPSGRVGLAVCATEIDVTAAVRELAPKLFISAGNGRFLDKSFSQESPGGELISSRAIVFGDHGGQRIDHAIVNLNDATVRLPHEQEAEGEI